MRNRVIWGEQKEGDLLNTAAVGRAKGDSNSASKFIRIAVTSAAVITAAVLVFIVAYVSVRGIVHLRLSMFSYEYNSNNVSMLPAIINTIIVTLIAVAAALPVGICAAVYLSEYSLRGNRFVRIIRLTVQTLAGIPSIIYGLFGYLVFVVKLGLGYSIIGGALTLSIMILPVIMTTTEEALMSVPDSLREGSFGLGAGRLRTVLRIVLPCAVPGIFAGILLSLGRIVGETAALIYTSGTSPDIPRSVTSSGRTLAVHIYALMSEGLYTDQAFSAAFVLLVIVAAMNYLSERTVRRFSKI